MKRVQDVVAAGMCTVVKSRLKVEPHLVDRVSSTQYLTVQCICVTSVCSTTHLAADVCHDGGAPVYSSDLGRCLVEEISLLLLRGQLVRKTPTRLTSGEAFKRKHTELL